jgi:hypothetical protein
LPNGIYGGTSERRFLLGAVQEPVQRLQGQGEEKRYGIRGIYMDKSKSEIALQEETQIDEIELFKRVSEIIENRKFRAQTSVNSEATLMFWEVGQYVNSVVLRAKRAAYGKQIVATLSLQLSHSLNPWGFHCQKVGKPADHG